MQLTFLFSMIYAFFMQPSMPDTGGVALFEAPGPAHSNADTVKYDGEGAIVRFDREKRNVYLLFSADEHFEGASHILEVLNSKDVKASFFLTGNCLRNKANAKIIQRIVDEGHYLGPHSDAHLLYNDWVVRDSLLVSKALFTTDLQHNMAALKPYGVDLSTVTWFLPPYEWYNKQIVNWSENLGLRLISFTPGIGTNADYTTPEMKNYRSSQTILNGLWKYEETHPYGLNGALILIHPGVHPHRTDKLYLHLGEIIDEMRERGYEPERVRQDK